MQGARVEWGHKERGVWVCSVAVDVEQWACNVVQWGWSSGHAMWQDAGAGWEGERGRMAGWGVGGSDEGVGVEQGHSPFTQGA